MQATAETNAQTKTGEEHFGNGKVRNGVEQKVAMGWDAATKPKAGGSVEEGEKGRSAAKAMTIDDEIASTLEAASEKLQAAHRKDRKSRKLSLSRVVGAISLKKFFSMLRDQYINVCVMAAEKGDFTDLASGHPGMYYGQSMMSRNISRRREQDEDEFLQASLSISLSRQNSQQPQLNRTTSTGIAGLSRSVSTGIEGLNRNTSNGFAGLNRNSSNGIAGLKRHTSTGNAGLNRYTSFGITGPNRQVPSTSRNSFGKSSSSSRKSSDSNPFSARRNMYDSSAFLDAAKVNPAGLIQDENGTGLRAEVFQQELSRISIKEDEPHNYT